MSRVIFITGARKGIGLALTKHYLARGDTVVGCSREMSDLKHAAYSHYAFDVADEAAVVNCFRDVSKNHGRLDALINNAGRASMNHALLTPAATLSSLFATNALGSFICLREGAKLMQKRKTGRIVNFTSVAVPLNLEGEMAYAASKAAVESITRIAARELGPFGITVNAVGPTPVDTDLIKGVPADRLKALLARQAIPRMGLPDDVAQAVDFFLDDKSGFITGQVLYLGGVG
ncbi:MAG TPA: SDR family oxidoreductase [Alphaproteobacteria bacterium]|nr:SDR family oxidoreductase [Alphaproteobacteria bacterium]